MRSLHLPLLAGAACVLAAVGCTIVVTLDDPARAPPAAPSPPPGAPPAPDPPPGPSSPPIARRVALGRLLFASAETQGRFVPREELSFLVGDGRSLQVRLEAPPPPGAGLTWSVSPGPRSGRVAPPVARGEVLTFAPEVQAGDRPLDGTRAPEEAAGWVSYRVRVSASWSQGTAEAEETIRQDERDAIRQEYVDLRRFFRGEDGQPFRLDVPRRDEIVEPAAPAFAEASNYRLVVDRGMTRLWRDVERRFGAPLRVVRAWRSPRHNVDLDGRTNQPHQTGACVDLRPADERPAGVERRVQWLRLYRAALAATAGEVSFDCVGSPPLPPRARLPEPRSRAEDQDRDGLPDGAPERRVLDEATWLHVSR